MAVAVSAWHSHHDRARGHRRSAAGRRVFKHQHLRWIDTVPSGSGQVDLWMWLALADVLAGEHEIEPVEELHAAEHVVREVRSAACGHSPGKLPLLKVLHQLHRAWHQREAFVEQTLKDLLRFSREGLDRVVQTMPFDHDPKGDFLRSPHHGIEEVAIERAAAAAEDFSPDILVELLGIDEKAVEVEGDSGNRRVGGRVGVEHQDFAILKRHVGGGHRDPLKDTACSHESAMTTSLAADQTGLGSPAGAAVRLPGVCAEFAASSTGGHGRMLFIKILAVVACVYVAVCLFFFVFQRSFIYRPTPLTPDHAAAVVVERPDAMLRVSTHVRSGAKALLFFGGNAEDVGITVPKLAELFPDTAVYGLHYRGYGGSSGRASETSLRGDARAVFAMVRERHPEVMLVGRSLGSSIAIGLAAEQPVSRLVLIAPFESILRIAARTAPFLPMRLLLCDRYESWRYAPRVTCPTLLLAASHDELVPMQDTQRLHDAFRPGVASLRVMQGTDHNTVASVPEFYEALLYGR